MIRLTPTRLTWLAAILLWMVCSRIPWLLNLAANAGLSLVLLISGYCLLWYAHRALFNGLVDPKGKCVLITGETGHLVSTFLKGALRFVVRGAMMEWSGIISIHSGLSSTLLRLV
ncbi:hypothetical protein MTO96_030822 [Rhipicephalus appendiculatus]